MYLARSTNEILTQALKKLASTTDISAVSPGSIARSLAELVATEIGDFTSTLDFNMSQSVLSTASGRALDLWGQLFDVERKKLSSIAADDAVVGAFYFYVNTPQPVSITIPQGTRVFTSSASALGQQIVYVTTADTIIQAGRLRGYASIAPLFNDTVFTAGVNTLVNHNANTNDVTVYCTNPKEISPTVGLESDADYRTRISKEIRVAAGGTEPAVRFAVLAIPGVRDVRVRDNPYGLGSFEVLVNSEDYSMSPAMVATAVQVVAAKRSVGVRAFVRAPDLIPMTVGVTLTRKQDAASASDASQFRAKNAILRYLNKLTIGEPMVYNQLVNAIFESSDSILDVTFTSLAVNGSQILRKNYTPQADEHIVPGEVTVTIGPSLGG